MIVRNATVKRFIIELEHDEAVQLRDVLRNYADYMNLKNDTRVLIDMAMLAIAIKNRLTDEILK